MNNLLTAFLFIVVSITLPTDLFGAKDRNDEFTITIKVEGLKDTSCQLAYYFGKKQYIRDSLEIDHKGTCVIKSENLPGGIYLLVLPGNKFFEFIVSGTEKEFSLKTSYDDLNAKMEISGSLENEVFFKNLNYVTSVQKKLNALNKRLKLNEGNKDSIRSISKVLNKVEKEVKASRMKIADDHPDLFYSKVIRLMKEPDIPKIPLKDGVKDSLYPYRYYKSHFFDGADFSDERLLYTPVYQNKLLKYINQLTVKHPDSINVGADYILGKASANPEVFKFSLVILLNRFANSKIMGMDAVYVHLVMNYYAKGKAFWIDSVQLIRMIDQAETLERVLLGKYAPNLILRDTSGKYIPLYGIQSKYIILGFWDPDCGHCKKAMPKLKTLYDELKSEGLTIYAVNTETEERKMEIIYKKALPGLDQHSRY